MGGATGPSNPDLVYEVFRAERRPLTSQEVFDAVQARRPITTKNPRATISGILRTSRQFVDVGDRRFGYLPYLVDGSVMRLPLPPVLSAAAPLTLPDEVRYALWPTTIDIQMRQDYSPFRVALPNGDVALLTHDWQSTGTMPPELAGYLAAEGAAPIDSLLIRVLDALGRTGEAWLERRASRDYDAVKRRNRALADAVEALIRDSKRGGCGIWELQVPLLGRGIYRDDVPPEPLKDVLRRDRRFVEDDLGRWFLTEQIAGPQSDQRRQRGPLGRLGIDLLPFGGTQPVSASKLAAAVTQQTLQASLVSVLAGDGSRTLAERSAELQRVLQAGGPPSVAKRMRLKAAQDLMYDAWDNNNPIERTRLAKQALEISPDCADAYVVLANETARTPKKAAQLYAEGVAAGERALGPEAFKRNAGMFWGMIETRPYMRARLGLAQADWELGEYDQAVTHAWDLLRLNPSDNQGVRYVLLSWLLERGDAAATARLLHQYPDDAAAVWSYGKALDAYRADGDSRRARGLLASAETANPHVPQYLLNRKQYPSAMPLAYSLGDESEAVHCGIALGSAWRQTPGALDWLADHSG